jgi:hypothetical protein
LKSEFFILWDRKKLAMKSAEEVRPYLEELLVQDLGGNADDISSINEKDYRDFSYRFCVKERKCVKIPRAVIDLH